MATWAMGFAGYQLAQVTYRGSWLCSCETLGEKVKREVEEQQMQ
jgi:hypothetical protein